MQPIRLTPQQICVLQDAVAYGHEAVEEAAEHSGYRPKPVQIRAPLLRGNAGLYFFVGYSLGGGGRFDCRGPGVCGGFVGSRGGEDEAKALLGVLLLIVATALATVTAVFAGMSVYNSVRAGQFQYRMHHCSGQQEEITGADLTAKTQLKVEEIYNKAHSINKGLYGNRVCNAIPSALAAAGLGLISATIIIVALVALKKMPQPDFNLWKLAAPGLALAGLGTVGLVTNSCCSHLWLKVKDKTMKESDDEIEELYNKCVTLVTDYPEILTPEFIERMGLVQQQ